MMLAWPLLAGFAALACYLWLQGKGGRLGPGDIAQAARAAGAAFSGLATTGLAIGGRWGLAAVTLIAMLAFVRSLIGAWRGALPFDAGGGRTSQVETASLCMRLDHGDDSMDGLVKRGRFEGAVLSLMSLEQLLELRDEIMAGDHASLALIEAFLDHAHADWRGEAGHGADANDDMVMDDAPMTHGRALELLGLSEGADAAAIKAAHRRLMAKVHPDAGGSDRLAAQVNAAKEFLLRNI